MIRMRCRPRSRFDSSTEDDASDYRRQRETSEAFPVVIILRPPGRGTLLSKQKEVDGLREQLRKAREGLVEKLPE